MGVSVMNSLFQQYIPELHHFLYGLIEQDSNQYDKGSFAYFGSNSGLY